MQELSPQSNPISLHPCQLLSSKDVANLIRIGESTLFKYVKANKFPQPYIKQHRFTRWRLQDIQQWLEIEPQPTAH